MNNNKRKQSPIRRWHRSLGLIAAVFTVFIVLSGMLINHSGSLGLSAKRLTFPALLDWYGLGSAKDIRSYAVSDQWLSFSGSQLYLDEQLVTTVNSARGAVATTDMLIAASHDELILITTAGEIIERLQWDQVPGSDIDAIGLLNDQSIVIRAGNQSWRADPDLMSWNDYSDNLMTPSWSKASEAPEQLQQRILQQYQGEGISLEQFILDLHSGRLFGSWGVLIYDLLSLALGFLAISGLVLWFKGRRAAKSNGNGKR